MADVQQEPVKKVPVKKTPVKKTPVKKKPVEDKPVEEKPVEKKPVSTQPTVRECVVDLVSYLRVRCLTVSCGFMSFAGHRPDVSRWQQERHESSDRPRKSRVELWPLRLLLRGWPLCVEIDRPERLRLSYLTTCRSFPFPLPVVVPRRLLRLLVPLHGL